jgi:hypothetical protein
MATEDYAIALHLLARAKVSATVYPVVCISPSFRTYPRLGGYPLADPSGVGFISTTSMSSVQTCGLVTHIPRSWNTIRRTANVTDLELSERFKRTAMYSTLHAVIPRQYQRQGYDLTPAQALPIPPQSEVIARWPGMAPDLVDEIVSNHQHESDRVAELELDDVYHRIRDMVVQEVIWGGNAEQNV